MSGNNRSKGDVSNRNGGSRFRSERLPGQSPGFSVETSLRDIVRIFFRHRRKALSTFAVILLAATAYALFSPREYRSEAKLFVRLGRENVGLDATTTLGQTPSVTSIPLSREEELNTVVEVLGSRSLLEKVVDAIGPEVILHPPRHLVKPVAKTLERATDAAPITPEDPVSESLFGILHTALEDMGLLDPLSARERAVVRLQKQVGVETIKKTNVILVSHEGPSPEISQEIVDKLIDFYLAEHVRMNRTPRAHEFLMEQATAEKSKLNRLENELRVLKNSTGLASPAEQRLTLVTQIGRLQDELKTTDSSAAAAEAEVAELKRRLGTMSETQVLGESAGFPNMAADGMRQQLYSLQLKEKDLASRVTDEHVELKFVRDQITSAKKVVDSLEPSRTQTTTGPNRTYEELKLSRLRQEAALASFRAKASTLKTQLADGKRQLQVLNDSELRIAQLQRDIQILDTNYRKYADSLEQARIDESLERQRISNINVAQPPTLSHRPVRPRPFVVLIVGFALALVGGLCLALVAEYFDHSLKTAEEIEHRLNLPVLGSIPQLTGRQSIPQIGAIS